jgi:hypothetical protein
MWLQSSACIDIYCGQLLTTVDNIRNGGFKLQINQDLSKQQNKVHSVFALNYAKVFNINFS